MGLLDAPGYSRTAADARFARPQGEKFRRAAQRAAGNNSAELPVMATPPTITAATATPDATLTAQLMKDAGYGGLYAYRGGVATDYFNYYRFPAVTIANGNAGPGAGVGSAVEFYTDAPKVTFNLLTPTPSTTGAMFEVDNQRVSATATAWPAAAGATSFFMLDFTTTGGSKVRRIRVEGNLGWGFRGVSIGPTYRAWAPGNLDKITVASVGDSISAQVGATLPNGGFNATLGKLLGWTDVRQVAIGGTGWVTPAGASTFGARVADVVAANPDLLLVTGSSNDSSSTPAAITAGVLAGLQAYRAALPSVPIVVGGVWAGSNYLASSWLAAEDAVAAAFTAWGDTNSYYVPMMRDAGGSWVFGTGHVGATAGNGNADFYVNAADTTHPSQPGHDYLAMRWANAFRKSILPVL